MGGRQVEEAAPGRSARIKCLECSAPPMARATFYRTHVKVCPGRAVAAPVEPQQGLGDAVAAAVPGQPALVACPLPSGQQRAKDGQAAMAQMAPQRAESFAQPSDSAPYQANSRHQASEGQGIQVDGMPGCEAEAAPQWHGALQAPKASTSSQPASLDAAAQSGGNLRGTACHGNVYEGAEFHAITAASALSLPERSAAAHAPPEGGAGHPLGQDNPNEMDEEYTSQSECSDGHSSNDDNDSASDCQHWSESDDDELEEGEDDYTKEGSAAYYRHWSGRQLYPGAKMTALQFSYLFSDWAMRNKVSSSAQEEMLRMLADVVLPPQNMCPPSKYKLRKQLG